ncbi:hypothetical protein BDP27DRAFT_1373297 [Rhodocollybia butyracea]|uniref:Uncharacterized protein n=1 Tax=Rhodocollybia butyracea TaxID=206335 RepID=A0A9P5TX91_9AGAR|nr:hypothetical protein BDP27DRAFT_1373297 [Rhodocollybia butyracea]
MCNIEDGSNSDDGGQSYTFTSQPGYFFSLPWSRHQARHPTLPQLLVQHQFSCVPPLAILFGEEFVVPASVRRFAALETMRHLARLKSICCISVPPCCFLSTTNSFHQASNKPHPAALQRVRRRLVLVTASLPVLLPACHTPAYAYIWRWRRIFLPLCWKPLVAGAGGRAAIVGELCDFAVQSLVAVDEIPKDGHYTPHATLARTWYDLHGITCTASLARTLEMMRGTLCGQCGLVWVLTRILTIYSILNPVNTHALACITHRICTHLHAPSTHHAWGARQNICAGLLLIIFFRPTLFSEILVEVIDVILGDSGLDEKVLASWKSAPPTPIKSIFSKSLRWLHFPHGTSWTR